MTNDEAKILKKWQLLSPYLDRRQQSLWAAIEAETLGHGGATLLSMLTGIPLDTIRLRRRKLRPTIGAAAESRTRGQRYGRFGRPRMEIKDPLKAISRFLDDQADLIERIRGDLLRGLKKPGGGRGGLTPSQVLRSLVLMRLKNWDYRELRERIDDGLTLRQFTDFYYAPVPKHDAFQRSFVRLRPRTLGIFPSADRNRPVALRVSFSRPMTAVGQTRLIPPIRRAALSPVCPECDDLLSGNRM